MRGNDSRGWQATGVKALEKDATSAVFVVFCSSGCSRVVCDLWLMLCSLRRGSYKKKSGNRTSAAVPQRPAGNKFAACSISTSSTSVSQLVLSLFSSGSGSRSSLTDAVELTWSLAALADSKLAAAVTPATSVAIVCLPKSPLALREERKRTFKEKRELSDSDKRESEMHC